MATRCRIAVELDGNTYKSIYCHYDGDEEWTGKVLREHYQNAEVVHRLIERGDIRYLEPEVERCPRVRKGWRPAKETDWRGLFEQALLDNAEYLYIYDPEGEQWIVIYLDAIHDGCFIASDGRSCWAVEVE